MSVLRGYQRQLKNDCYDAWNGGYNGVMAMLPTGMGKCLGRGTPVLMYDGTVRAVETIVAGERLMGPDGLPRLVLSTVVGNEQLYRVTPVKGDSYVVNASHILSLKRTAVYSGDPRKGEVVNVTVGEWLAASNNWRHIHKGWRTGVEFEPNNGLRLVPPYILGAWLGDGTESRITAISSVDNEVISAWADWGQSLGCGLRIEERGTCPTYHLRTDNNKNPALNRLQAIGVHGNRHIPLEYKTASRAERLELLAGILDTDGYAHHGGFDFVSKSKVLADDVAYLARSLGFAAYVQAARKRCTNTDAWGDYWRLFVSGDVAQIPCRVARRKQALRSQKKDVLVTGLTVEPIGPGDYFGFEIDGDRLFMLGDFTVTHNTVVIGEICNEHNGYGLALAHRSVLVAQISQALAREGVKHSLIAAEATKRQIRMNHMEEFGRNWVDPNAKWACASVDTLIAMNAANDFFRKVTLAIADEGHHVLKKNKWGRAFGLFQNSRFLMPTATPGRSDGMGLGSHADGYADILVRGPEMRWGIDNGYLTDYRVFCPKPTDLDLSGVDISKTTGEFNTEQLRKAMANSTSIVGDVVKHYVTHAMSKLGVTFAVDISEATKIAAGFNLAGVPAAVITADTPETERNRLLRDFRDRKIWQLVNVDLFGEGFDLPAIECVSMARPTASFGLFTQQWGRALRLMINPVLMAAWDTYTVTQRLQFIRESQKPKAIIFDHVGNVLRHLGPPDKPRPWSLDRRSKRSGPSDAIPMYVCESCEGPYEIVYKVCPHCGHERPAPEPSARSSANLVDGDLFELLPEVLKNMRGDVDKIDGPAYVPNALQSNPNAARAVVLNHHTRKVAQFHLRKSIDWWAGIYPDDDDSINYKRFFHTFKIDVLSAMALGAPDADKLRSQVNEKLIAAGVDESLLTI